MAEFVDLGQHCKICKNLDFLPIACKYCQAFFCKEHFSATAHHCEEYSKLDNYIDDDQLNIIKKLSCNQCNKKCVTLEIIHCDTCNLDFCFEHRLQEDHNCKKLIKEKKDLLEKANKKNLIIPKNVEYKVKGAKNDALQNKVLLMKLKHKAKGLNSIPINERMYFFIHDDIHKTVHEYFLSTKWSIGRIIDYLSNELKITNNNNDITKPKLVLKIYEQSNELDYLPFEKTIEYFNENLFNGQKLILLYN